MGSLRARSPPRASSATALVTAPRDGRRGRRRRRSTSPPRFPTGDPAQGLDPGSVRAASSLDLARVEGLAERIVTVSPDVSVSTNLGGWINKVGVFAPEEEPDYARRRARAARWRASPHGPPHRARHLRDESLPAARPAGADARATRASSSSRSARSTTRSSAAGSTRFIYGALLGRRFVVAGTPSGVTLSREGGAHQSTVTPSIGLELPGSHVRGADLRPRARVDPARWAAAHGGRRRRGLYLRLSTKPIEQAPFADLCSRRGEEAVRADVLAGGFWLQEPGPEGDAVILATCGAMAPEVLGAARLLEEEEGVAAGVLCLSSPARLYREWRAKRLTHLRDLEARRDPSHLERLVAPRPAQPAHRHCDRRRLARARLPRRLSRHACRPPWR